MSPAVQSLIICKESSYATNTPNQPILTAERAAEPYRCFMRVAVRVSSHSRGVEGKPDGNEQDKPNKRELRRICQPGRQV